MDTLQITLHDEDPLGVRLCQLGHRYRLHYIISYNARGVTIFVDALPGQRAMPLLLAGKIPCFEDIDAAEAFVDMLCASAPARPSWLSRVWAFLTRVYKRT